VGKSEGKREGHGKVWVSSRQRRWRQRACRDAMAMVTV